MTEIVTQNAVAQAPAMPQAVAALPASTAPAKPAAPKPLAVALPKPEPAKPAPAKPMAKDGSRYFAIHLASYRRQADAVRGWMDLKKRFGGSLKTLEPRIAQTQLGAKGQFLRLKAGPFETWSAANEACEGLRRSGWICTVMDFSGDTLEGV
jgi:cell division septation protein DedD